MNFILSELQTEFNQSCTVWIHLEERRHLVMADKKQPQSSNQRDDSSKDRQIY